MRTALDIVRLQLLSQPKRVARGLAIEHQVYLDECEIDRLAGRFKTALAKFDSIGDADPTPAQRDEYNRVAREEMRSDDRVSFDSPAETALSPSEDGCYVQAWVWVAKEEIECPHDRTRMDDGISSCLECGDRIDTDADADEPFPMEIVAAQKAEA
jgi:Asp-tRNA(Asn)/Glu-tRNA(Gln) amidotransferase C subunit